MFLNHIGELPQFPKWIRTSIASIIQGGEAIDHDTIHMSMPPTLKARSYRSMYAYGNHIRVVSVKEHLTTYVSGIVATFEQTCVLRLNEKLEYVGWVEKILELNYGILNIVVLLCNWVKTNYTWNNATIKRDGYSFTLVNFAS